MDDAEAMNTRDPSVRGASAEGAPDPAAQGSTRRRAVGIACAPGALPSVVVKGAGVEVDSVLRRARHADIPVVQDPRLVDRLYRLPVGAPIGRDLFPVMAALIAHVLVADRSTPDGLEVRR